MNIWLVTIGEPLPSDGMDVRLYRTGLLADILANQGHSVIWWSSAYDHMKKATRFKNDTTIFFGSNYKLKLLSATAYSQNVSIKRALNHVEIARVFSREALIQKRPDIILVSLPTLELSLAAVKYGKLNKIPVVIDIRDLWPDIFTSIIPGFMRPFSQLLLLPFTMMMKTICRDATAIIGITPRIIEWGLHYAGREGTCWDRDFPLAYPDAPLEDGLIHAAEIFWDNLGIYDGDDNQFVTCFFGTLGRQFDIETVIEAAKILEERNTDIRVVICGTGDNLEKYKHMAASCDSVIFPGWLGAAEIRILMQRAKSGMAPYLSTFDFEMSIPNKIIEYLSAGLPVISSLCGTVADLIRQNNCGLTYKQGNPEELANILEDLRADPARQKVISDNARTLYLAKFTTEKVYGDLSIHLGSIASHYNAGE